MSESNIQAPDTFPDHKWTSHGLGYPFEVNQAGRMVYFGRAMAGQDKWEGQSGEAGYITLDGTPQEIGWTVQYQHRPVRLVLFHEDGSNNPSSANMNVDYEYRERAMSGGNVSRWNRINSILVATEPTYNERFGETNEVRDVEYRLTLQGTNGHEVRVVPYNQYLQKAQFTGRRQGTR